MTAKAAAVGLLIAVSGCTEKVDASDPPVIGLAAESETYVYSEMPAEIVTESPPPAESPPKAGDEPTMRSPVQFD